VVTGSYRSSPPILGWSPSCKLGNVTLRLSRGRVARSLLVPASVGVESAARVELRRPRAGVRRE
jgi:hypothetical protein